MSARNNARYGHVKGVPLKFIHQHHARVQSREPRKADRYEIVDAGYKTPCWIWLLKGGRSGSERHGFYGRDQVNGRTMLAHRAMYERMIGPIPEGMHLDHLCRQTLCVNPEHLEVVTQLENVRRGASAKLSAADRGAIRERLSSGERAADIATAFGISRTYVYRVARATR